MRDASRWLAPPLLAVLLAGAGASPARAGEIRVEGGEAVLEVGDYRATFEQKPAWTLRRLAYQGRELLTPTGWMQTVINRQVPEGEDPWIGTGHGKEIVEHADVVVDGRAYPLTPGLRVEGEHFTIRKRSRLGPFAHRSKVELDATGLRERFAYEVVEDASQVNYMYAFMHCMANTTGPWAAELANGQEVTGQFLDDGSFTLKRDVRWVAAYDPTLGVGLAFAYPRAYPSWQGLGNMLWNRAYDNKLYLKVDPLREVGDRFGYAVELRGFEATEANWRQRAEQALALMLAEPVAELGPEAEDDLPPAVAEGAGRPPEMVAAGRTEPQWPELASFDDLADWRVEVDAPWRVTLRQAEDDRVFGAAAAQLVVEADTEELPDTATVRLLPSRAIEIPTDANAIRLWMRVRQQVGYTGPGTFATATAILRDSRGRRYEADLGTTWWGVWDLMQFVLVNAQTGEPNYVPAQPMSPPVVLEELTFAVQPRHLNLPLLVGVDSLTAGRFAPTPRPAPYPLEALPEPTTPDTIAPVLRRPVTHRMERDGSAVVLIADDGQTPIRWRIDPRTGTLGDIELRGGQTAFRPAVGGGLMFELGGEVITPDAAAGRTRLLGQTLRDGQYQTRWRIEVGGEAATYELTYRLIGKSLVVDVTGGGGKATAVVFGHTAQTPGAELVPVPYLRYNYNGGPQVVSFGDLFLLGLSDWWHAHGSYVDFRAEPTPDGQGVYYNGLVRYDPLTDGTRNEVRERLFFNASTIFEEVLPTPPNAPSPYLEEYAGATWRWWGGDPLALEWVDKLHAYGVKGFQLRLHANAMRDQQAGESYALRTDAAISVGRRRLREVSEHIQSLGYGFALYSCYIDIEAVNPAFDPAALKLQSSGQWHRLHRLKPLDFLALHSRLAPQIVERFDPTFSYLDVHSCREPWRQTDMDSTAPMAGQYRLDFLANAHIMRRDREIHGGPVFGEGGMQWMYAGFVDATYGYLGYGSWNTQPDLVDFSVLRIHPRMIQIAMGAPSMYFKGYTATGDGGVDLPAGGMEQRTGRFDPRLDQMLAASIAYGHAGWQFSPPEWGIAAALKSHFAIRAVQQRYIPHRAVRIGYSDGERIHDTSAAIRNGALERGFVHVAYDNGLKVYVNLNRHGEDWRVEHAGRTYHLSPTGYLAVREGDLLAWSAVEPGQTYRTDYQQSEDYLYLDTRDHPAAGPLLRGEQGAVTVYATGANQWRVVPLPEVAGVQLHVEGLELLAADTLRPGAALLWRHEEASDEAWAPLTPDAEGWLDLSAHLRDQPIVIRVAEPG